MLEKNKILVTGSTGFLGGAIAANLTSKHLLESTLFLVRASTKKEGLTKVRKTFKRFNLSESEFDSINEKQIICGDLSDVNTFAHDPRINQITHVINSAAVTSFNNDPRIWPVNVEGTFKFAQRMSKVKGFKRFLHVGTAMSCGLGLTSPIPEKKNLDNKQGHLVQYTSSKASIENLIHSELPNLPFIVARPSIIVGHTQLGCIPSGSIFWMFRAIQAMKKFISSLTDKIDVIPVDYCAEALVTLAMKEHLSHDVYHVSAGSHSNSMKEIYEAYSQDGNEVSILNDYQQISFKQISELVQDFQMKFGKKFDRRLIAKALQSYGNFASLNYVFDNARIIAEGIKHAAPFASYVGLCAKTSANIDIHDQMRADFK